MVERLEKRMYFFVMYNISEIQKGIQAGHVVEEYCDLYYNETDYREYRKDKTWIILNGGASNNMGKTYYDDTIYYGSMEGLLAEVKQIGVNHASFNEPDLNNATSAICFLVDERVFDYEKYPDFKNWYIETHNLSTDDKKIFLKTKQIDYPNYYGGSYDEWVDVLGGVMNLQLRQLLKGKRFA